MVWEAPDVDLLDHDEDVEVALMFRHRALNKAKELPLLAGPSLARWQEIAKALHGWNENGGPWPLGKK